MRITCWAWFFSSCDETTGYETWRRCTHPYRHDGPCGKTRVDNPVALIDYPQPA
ncbi:hypothetical protein [Mycolicibacterium mucogenicum]|jgi:hypothetical protein|uniref:hypothetical protein n=1 Tax=Mycolicibacterium mucogenicum TaxID=56689 RepID=UPI000AFAED78|nr:hypothetical protein [Mycolicibacterium mucogenicum]